MSHRFISLVFVCALAGACVVFAHRPPRAQRHLAALDAAVQQALRGQRAVRLFFQPKSDVETYVWCRYFAAPRVLVAGVPGAGDTVLSIVRGGDSVQQVNAAAGKLIADSRVASTRAVLYIAR